MSDGRPSDAARSALLAGSHVVFRLLDDVTEVLDHILGAGLGTVDPHLSDDLEDLAERTAALGMTTATTAIEGLHTTLADLRDADVRGEDSSADFRAAHDALQTLTAWRRVFRAELDLDLVLARLERARPEAPLDTPDERATVTMRVRPVGLELERASVVLHTVAVESGQHVILEDELSELDRDDADGPLRQTVISRLFQDRVVWASVLASDVMLEDHPFEAHGERRRALEAALSRGADEEDGSDEPADSDAPIHDAGAAPAAGRAIRIRPAFDARPKIVPRSSSHAADPHDLPPLATLVELAAAHSEPEAFAASLEAPVRSSVRTHRHGRGVRVEFPPEVEAALEASGLEGLKRSRRLGVALAKHLVREHAAEGSLDLVLRRDGDALVCIGAWTALDGLVVPSVDPTAFALDPSLLTRRVVAATADDAIPGDAPQAQRAAAWLHAASSCVTGRDGEPVQTPPRPASGIVAMWRWALTMHLLGRDIRDMTDARSDVARLVDQTLRLVARGPEDDVDVEALAAVLGQPSATAGDIIHLEGQHVFAAVSLGRRQVAGRRPNEALGDGEALERHESSPSMTVARMMHAFDVRYSARNRSRGHASRPGAGLDWADDPTLEHDIWDHCAQALFMSVLGLGSVDAVPQPTSPQSTAGGDVANAGALAWLDEHVHDHVVIQRSDQPDALAPVVALAETRALLAGQPLRTSGVLAPMGLKHDRLHRACASRLLAWSCGERGGVEPLREAGDGLFVMFAAGLGGWVVGS